MCGHTFVFLIEAATTLQYTESVDHPPKVDLLLSNYLWWLLGINSSNVVLDIALYMISRLGFSFAWCLCIAHWLKSWLMSRIIEVWSNKLHILSFQGICASGRLFHFLLYFHAQSSTHTKPLCYPVKIPIQIHIQRVKLLNSKPNILCIHSMTTLYRLIHTKNWLDDI